MLGLKLIYANKRDPRNDPAKSKGDRENTF